MVTSHLAIDKKIAQIQNLLNKYRQISVTGINKAISKTIELAERLKHRVKGLYQNNSFERVPNSTKTRIKIILSLDPLNSEEKGYQAPLPDDQIQEINKPNKKLKALFEHRPELNEKLSMYLLKLISPSNKTQLPILTSSASMTDETVTQIEHYSSLPLIRMAISDEEMSRKSIIKRVTLSNNSLPLVLDICLPSSSFNVSDFDLDIFKLAEEYGQVTLLSMYAQKIFAHWNLFISMDFNVQVFLRYCQYIGEGYKPNPYHNVLHAADVMQACHTFLLTTKLVEISEMTPLHITALLLSALVHDYKHPGVTNSYLYMTNNKLAIRYNDSSILENYHISKAFQVAQNEKTNIFSNISKEEYRALRKLMISAVLGTDMTKHSNHVNDVQTKLGPDRDLKDEKEFLICLLMHLGDLSNPCRNQILSEQWSLRVCEEFFNQGDKEKSNNIPISPLMDRYSINIAKSQIGFISGVVLPFITPICEEIKGLEYLLTNAHENKNAWGNRIDEFEEKLVKAREQRDRVVV
ncbi:hypothetical protein SteCoe_20107 [Stentor coeruleus]|uniref:Phosphodiesterase n=1 Tax=Stentor coeruleus TaxID=5963 RepID=A0A1R2BSL4_9CILI|nr:hypothetical protein SteCoe_20107 [Stentor coeruleus]